MLLRVPCFHTLRIKRVAQGREVSVLVDGGSNHNSIDSSCMEGDTLDVMEDKHEEDENS